MTEAKLNDQRGGKFVTVNRKWLAQLEQERSTYRALLLTTIQAMSQHAQTQVALNELLKVKLAELPEKDAWKK